PPIGSHLATAYGCTFPPGIGTANPPILCNCNSMETAIHLADVDLIPQLSQWIGQGSRGGSLFQFQFGVAIENIGQVDGSLNVQSPIQHPDHGFRNIANDARSTGGSDSQD